MAEPISVTADDPPQLPTRNSFGLRNVTLHYGATVALDDVTLAIEPGSVHGLIGENGSGKSSLVKVLSGVLRPQRGEVIASGEPAHFRRPADARTAGIATTYQETLVAEEMSVLDNIAMGDDRLVRPSRRRREMAARASELLEQLGCGHIPLEARLRDLPLSQRHLVAIARSLARPSTVLILDEPTSALDVTAREALFGLVRRQSGEGRAVLYISHRMDEIDDLADTVSVLRAGRKVATMSADDATPDALLELMTGDVSAARRPPPPSRPSPAGPARLRVTTLRLTPGSRSADVDLREGEMVGLAGLEGHGQVEFLRSLGGWQKAASGTVSVLEPGRDPIEVTGARRASDLGIAYVPGDRKREGIFAGLSALENLLITTMPDYTRGGLLRPGVYRRAGEALAHRLGVRGELSGPIERLSGGNQQKVVVGRWVARTPRVLLLEDPMRGIDVPAKAAIFDVLERLCSEGAVAVLLSTELSELVQYCSRVLVFRNMSVVASLGRTELTEQAILAAMVGAGEDSG
jgi:ABC-type sugar transport system ATPase subunit